MGDETETKIKRSTQVLTVAWLPVELIEAWMQHVRDFDAAHPGCHFYMQARGEWSADEMTEMLRRIDPPLPHITTVKKH